MEEEKGGEIKRKRVEGRGKEIKGVEWGEELATLRSLTDLTALMPKS